MSTLRTQMKFQRRCTGNVLQPSNDSCIYYSGQNKDTYRFNGIQRTAKYYAYLIYHSQVNHETNLQSPEWKSLTNTCNQSSCINPLHVTHIPKIHENENETSHKAKRLSRKTVKEIRDLVDSVDGKLDHPSIIKYCQDNNLDISKILKIQRRKIYSSIPG